MSNNTDFERHKENLFRIAYRMLGSFSDAEDLVQETWLRWNKLDQREIEVPGAYLTRILSHLCIDLIRSRKKNADHYKGPWLPSPLMTEDVQETHQKFETFDELWNSNRSISDSLYVDYNVSFGIFKNLG
jgi:RNA polymerase sigma-70 factor (ECF subfamily)